MTEAIQNTPVCNQAEAEKYATTATQRVIILPIVLSYYTKILLHYENLNADDNYRVPCTSWNQAPPFLLIKWVKKHGYGQEAEQNN